MYSSSQHSKAERWILDSHKWRSGLDEGFSVGVAVAFRDCLLRGCNIVSYLHGNIKTPEHSPVSGEKVSFQ